MTASSFRFTVDQLRVLYAALFGFFAVLQLVQAFNPGKGGIGLTVFALVGAAVCLLLCIRGARGATVAASDGGFEYRSLVRTRRWTASEVDGFEARDSREGVAGYRRRVLFVREVGGRVRKLQEINARASLSPNPIDGVAEALNARLTKRDGRP